MESFEVCDKCAQVCQKCLILTVVNTHQRTYIKQLQSHARKIAKIAIEGLSIAIKEGDRRHTS
jgi:predicted DNA-binding protein (UPF0251 family)